MSSKKSVVLKYLRAQKKRFDNHMLTCSVLCQIREISVQLRGTLVTYRVVKLKNLPYMQVVGTPRQKLEAFADQSLDEVTTLYV